MTAGPAMPFPLATWLPRLVALAESAGQAILDAPRDAVQTKGDGSPVARADRAAHAVIMAGLAGLAPDLPIVSEEGVSMAPAERVRWTSFWLVDPLDGTKEYLQGVPDFTVNIALIHHGVPVAGVVHSPARAVTYYAAEGQGSWRARGGDTARLVARPPAPGAALRIVESRSHRSPDLDAFLAPYRIGERVAIGSSLKCCLVAEGRADAYVRLGPTMEWDLAAGDAVFRWAVDAGTAHPSALTYNKPDLRHGPFVLGFLPPPPAVLWLTGLSGSGKSTIATALARRLQTLGAAVEVIDGDAMRAQFPGTGFGRVDRDAHVRRVGYLASRLEAHGVTVVAALISPYRDSRAAVRAMCRHLVEIHVATALADCERRDPKGLYAKARAGTLTQFTGIDDPYEVPEHPDLVVDTIRESAEAAATRIVAWLTDPAKVSLSGEVRR